MEKKQKHLTAQAADTAFELLNELPNPMLLNKEIRHIKKIEQKLWEAYRLVLNMDLRTYIEDTIKILEKFRIETLSELRDKKLSPSQREYVDKERHRLLEICITRISEIKARI